MLYRAIDNCVHFIQNNNHYFPTTQQQRTPLHFAVMCAPAEYSRSLRVVQQLIYHQASFLPDMVRTLHMICLEYIDT